MSTDEGSQELHLVLRGAVAVARRRQVGQVTEGALAVVSVAEAEALDLARLGEAEQLGLPEHRELLRRMAPDRLRGLDLEPAVAAKAGGRRDQLPDDHVLLQAEQPVGLALEGG